MTLNQTRLMFIPLLATLIMAGFVTTIGLMTEPAADHYGVSITDVASQFSWLTAGVFIGGILAFFVFDYASIRKIILASYIAGIGLICWLHISNSYLLLPVLLGLIGNFFAIVGCGGVTIITQQWRGSRSRTIMVAQDAMFNGGGIAFSALATWFVVNSFGWTSVYLVVSVLLGIVVLLAWWSSFDPAMEIERDEGDTVGVWNAGIIVVGISLFFFMMAKISIFVWAPQFIQ
jgi:TsgA-like MFS transporter